MAAPDRIGEATPAPDPARVRSRLLRWYRANARDFFWRDGPSALPLGRFQVLLVEFLLWKTNAARSEPVIRELVLRHSDPREVSEVSVARLQDDLRPLGLHRRRAACLAVLSAQLVERHGGDVPPDVAALQALTGIGQYAARATACVLEGSRLMPVDANSSRLFGRLHGTPGPPVRTPGARWDALLAPYVPRRAPERFLWATMDLAAAHCVATRPRCSGCPLRRDCATWRLTTSAMTGDD